MAGNTPQHELERLYKLIQQERLDEAAVALRSIVRSDKDNEDVWWLLANAATDPSEAKESLENVIRLNPSRQDAQNLLAQLQEAYPDLIPLSPEASLFNPSDIGDPFRPITPTPTVTLADDLDDWMTDAQPAEQVADDSMDWLNASQPAEQSNDPLDSWLNAPQPPDANEPVWMPQSQTPQPVATETLPTDDPFDFEDDNKTPGFASAPQTPVAPKHAQPEFHPEGFEGVLPHQPASIGDPVIGKEVPPADEEESHRFVPILMGLMLLVVIGISAFYFLTNRTSDVVPPPPNTATPTFAEAALPTIDPNATLPTSAGVGATETILPTLTSTGTPGFTISDTPAVTLDVSATPVVAADVTLTATAVSAATDNAVSTFAPETPVAPTIPAATAPLAESLSKLTENFKTAGFADANFNIGDTVLGKTLTVKICSKPGIDLLRATDKVRDVIATEAAPYRAELEAVGVQIVSCSDAASVLYGKAVPIRVATQYAEKKIDARKYRASWINP